LFCFTPHLVILFVFSLSFHPSSTLLGLQSNNCTMASAGTKEAILNSLDEDARHFGGLRECAYDLNLH
jgi:hypothetical protein